MLPQGGLLASGSYFYQDVILADALLYAVSGGHTIAGNFARLSSEVTALGGIEASKAEAYGEFCVGMPVRCNLIGSCIRILLVSLGLDASLASLAIRLISSVGLGSGLGRNALFAGLELDASGAHEASARSSRLCACAFLRARDRTCGWTRWSELMTLPALSGAPRPSVTFPHVIARGVGWPRRLECMTRHFFRSEVQSRHVEGSAQLSVADQPVLCEKLECSGPASSIDDPGDSTWPSFEIGASEAGAPSERRELIVTVGVVFAFELQGSEVCRCGGGSGMREDVCEAGVENCYQVVGAAGQISR